MWLKWLHHTRRIPEDLTTLLEPPKRWKRLPQTLNLDRTVELITSPDLDHPLGLRDRAILELFYACGLRSERVVRIADEGFQSRRGVSAVYGQGPPRTRGPDRGQGARRDRGLRGAPAAGNYYSVL